MNRVLQRCDREFDLPFKPSIRLLDLSDVVNYVGSSGWNVERFELHFLLRGGLFYEQSNRRIKVGRVVKRRRNLSEFG